MKTTLMILLLSQIFFSSCGQVANNDQQINIYANKTTLSNKTDSAAVILIADSVAKAELQKYNDSHPNVISAGELSLKYYDRTIETILDGLYSFQVIYKFNQLIGGTVVFPSFSVIVNLDTKETRFINKTINERRTFVGTAIISDSKPLFVWEFADSEAFYLDGLKSWDNKYLNKTITVEGILTQYIDGVYSGSVIKDWKIIDNKGEEIRQK